MWNCMVEMLPWLYLQKNSAVYHEEEPKKSRFPQCVSYGQTDISINRVASLLKISTDLIKVIPLLILDFTVSKYILGLKAVSL